MKLKTLLACVAECEPQALVGVRRALFLARLFPRAFRSAKIRLAVPQIQPGQFFRDAFASHPVKISDVAAILFTSGSTGIPKGVVYTHGAFDAQARLLKETYGIGPDEIDLVVFPLFALFAAAWGITAVIPNLDPARPARANGKHLADLIRKFAVTHTAGSPAVWRRLAEHCLRAEDKFPSLKRILMAGAQVPEKLVRAYASLGVAVHTPYGATEALPLTTISYAELFESYPRTREGGGTCVGRPLAGVDVAILPFTDDAISSWDENLRQPRYTKGEIVVRAAWVTTEYFQKAEATRKSKIPSANGVWHRMGDVGYLDDAGRLWFCGRKDHRIVSNGITVFPDPIEAIFDSLPNLSRTAVVGVGPAGAQRSVLVVEGASARIPVAQLREHAKKFAAAAPLSGFAFRREFPVDVRHNIKIDRPKLARLIESEIV